MGNISYHAIDTAYALKQKRQVSAWVKTVVHQEGKRSGDIAFVFCTDDYLLELNRKHLQHDCYTDIVTFDYSEGEGVSGDLFISIDRVGENAAGLGVAFLDELHRVMIHGVLHLCGYGDKTEAEQRRMRLKEDASLAMRWFTAH